MKISLTALLFAVVLTDCTTSHPPAEYSGKPAIDISVNITCTDPAMKFTGAIVTDDKTEKVSGIRSGTFHATGHDLACSFKKTGHVGRISLAASTSDQGHGTCTTGAPHGGVHAEFLHTAKETHDIFTTF